MDDSSVVKFGEVGERAGGSGVAGIPIHRKLEKLRSQEPEKPVSDSVGRQFEGTELCSRDFSLPRVRGGCGSSFFPSPRQASSWRWRRLPPRGGAFPPWARGPPRCWDPGFLLPGIRGRLPNAEARSSRHLRAPEATLRLPAAGSPVSHRQGLGPRLSMMAEFREAVRRGRRGVGMPRSSCLCAAPRSPPMWMLGTLLSLHHCASNAIPATGAHRPPTMC